MVPAAADRQAHPPGLVSLLDLPLGGGKGGFRLRAGAVRLDASGRDLVVGTAARPDGTV